MKTLIYTLIASASIFSFTSCMDGKTMKNIITAMAKNSEDLSDLPPSDTVTISKQIAVPGSFSSIHTSGGYEIILRQDSAASIVFEGRKAYSDSAVVEVKDGTLNISAKEDRFSRGKLIITLPTLTAVTTEGAGDILLRNFNQEEDIKIETNGAGDIELKGSKLNNIKIETNGAGDIELKSITCHDVDIESNGAVEVDIDRINANIIKVMINGAGDIEASGHCKDFNCNVSGAGEVDTKELNITGNNAGSKAN